MDSADAPASGCVNSAKRRPPVAHAAACVQQSVRPHRRSHKRNGVPHSGETDSFSITPMHTRLENAAHKSACLRGTISLRSARQISTTNFALTRTAADNLHSWGETAAHAFFTDPKQAS